MDENSLVDEFAIQRAVYESLNANSERQETETHSALNEKQIFDFINKNLDKLRNNTNDVLNVLSMLDRLMQMQAKRTGCPIDIGAYIAHLVKQNKHDNMNLTSVLQILYQILKTLKQADSKIIKLSEDVMGELIDLLLASEDRQLNANMIACLQLYVQLFEENKIIENLWKGVIEIDLQKDVPLCISQILVQLFDEFMHSIGDIHVSSRFIDIVQKLLTSNMDNQRKSAHFLLRKVTKVICERACNITQWEMDTTNELELWWNAYITAMESLEHNQTDYILSSLDNFKIMQCRNPYWKKWIFILYKQILNHSDILVVRWAVEYFLEAFTCLDLDAEILSCLISALNNSHLYNNEGYFLAKQNIKKFVCGDCTPFLKAMSDIKWSSVPLHFWLSEVESHVGTIEISKELLLKIASKIRDMQNERLHSKAILLFQKIFNPLIEKMDLTDYITLIATLDNGTNSHIDLKAFVKKFELCTNYDSVIFSQRLYELLLDCTSHTELLAFLNILGNLPKEKHGWLRFIAFNLKDTEEKKSFCRSHYDIDLDALTKYTLDEIIEEFRKKLMWHETEENFVRSIAVDHFVCNFSDFTECGDDLSKHLEMGSNNTLSKLSELLASHEGELSSTILDSFVEGVNKFATRENHETIKNILKYCLKRKTPEVAQQYAEKILNIDLENLKICEAVLDSEVNLSKECVIRGVLVGEAETVEERIEVVYDRFSICSKIREYYVEFTHCDRKEITNDLLKLNNELIQKISKDYKNSKEHLLQMRIVRYITYETVLPFWSDELWEALLAENNEPNIKYIYEFLIAYLAEDCTVIISKLNEIMNYTENQKISLIWVAHHYCIDNYIYSASELDEIINKLLPLTMCGVNETRICSQLAIYNILEQDSRSNEMIGDLLQSTIKDAIGDKLTVLLTDVRFSLPCRKYELWFFLSVLMKVTNSPFDEYFHYDDLDEFNTAIIFENQSKIIQNQLTSQEKPTTLNEMNDNGLTTNNLISYPDNIAISEIYVVASLIEDPFYLNRIVRTCELLGIRNLVCNLNVFQKSVTIKKLSNIVNVKAEVLQDYLIQKQIEGFSIVGSEKSMNNIKSVDFIFPRKCILVLGHEKDGIPCNLLGFLDYAVEIGSCIGKPMNGEILMLEYCKQHF